MSRQLTKSSTDKVIDGVCGGIAEYFEVDSTIIRILWALAVFLGGTGVIAYIVCMIVIPDEEKVKARKEGSTAAIEGEEHGEEQTTTDPDRNRDLLGLGLIIIGTYFLIDKFLPWMRLNRFWPVILIAVGVYFLSKKD
jgi:phage shock protein PspC (stress-responsive transcriptional regulator)